MFPWRCMLSSMLTVVLLKRTPQHTHRKKVSDTNVLLLSVSAVDCKHWCGASRTPMERNRPTKASKCDNRESKMWCILVPLVHILSKNATGARNHFVLLNFFIVLLYLMVMAAHSARKVVKQENEHVFMSSAKFCFVCH